MGWGKSVAIMPGDLVYEESEGVLSPRNWEELNVDRGNDLWGDHDTGVGVPWLVMLRAWGPRTSHSTRLSMGSGCQGVGLGSYWFDEDLQMECRTEAADAPNLGLGAGCRWKAYLAAGYKW